MNMHDEGKAEGKAEGNHHPRVQKVGQTYGFDWTGAWNFLQKVGPVLREVLITILEQSSSIHISTSAYNGPGMVADNIEIHQVAQMYGTEGSELQDFLNKVGPALAQIILALLKKKDTLEKAV
jgi:hypothetical protein